MREGRGSSILRSISQIGFAVWVRSYRSSQQARISEFSERCWTAAAVYRCGSLSKIFVTANVSRGRLIRYLKLRLKLLKIQPREGKRDLAWLTCRHALACTTRKMTGLRAFNTYLPYSKVRYLGVLEPRYSVTPNKEYASNNCPAGCLPRNAV